MKDAPSIENLNDTNFLRIFNLLLNLEAQYNLSNSKHVSVSVKSQDILIPELRDDAPHHYGSEIFYLGKVHVLELTDFLWLQENKGIVELPQDVLFIALNVKKFQEILARAKKRYSIPQHVRSKTKEDSEIAYWITYTTAREIVVNGIGKSFLLKKLNFSGENDNVFGYLDKHPNTTINKKALEIANGGKLMKSLPKIVEKLGFKGDLLRAFFNVNENEIFFRKSVTKKQIHELGIRDIKLPDKSVETIV